MKDLFKSLILCTLLILLTLLEAESAQKPSKLSEEHNSDLRELKLDINELIKKQREFQGSVEEITITNENKRIKLLEIVEKARRYKSMKNCGWALEWIAEGLKLDPINLMLLDTKRECLLLIGNYKESIKISTLIIEMNPPNLIVSVLNLLESLALINEPKEFETVYQKYITEIEKDENNNLVMTYLRVLQNIVSNDIPKARAILLQFIPDLSGIEADSYIYFFERIWSIEVAQAFISALETPQQKQYLQTLNNYFTGKLSSKQLKEFLSADGLYE